MASEWSVHIALLIDAMHKFDDWFRTRALSIYIFGENNVDTRPDVVDARLAYDKAMSFLENEFKQSRYDALEK